LAELIVSGTFEWRVKRRDIGILAKEWDRFRPDIPIFTDPLPDSLSSKFKAGSLSSLDFSTGVRMGLVPDRFQSGFKLKCGMYIANNCVILSFVDIAVDFDGR
jgi:hypothetical protein